VSKRSSNPSRGSRRRPPADGQLSRLARLRQATSSLLVASISVWVTLITAAVAVEEVRQQFSGEPRAQLESVVVPGSLAARGFTGEVTARRLLDAVKAIQAEARTHKTFRSFAVDAPAQVDIELPGSKTSVSTLLTYIRQLTSTEPPKLTGEVLNHGTEDDLELTLRIGMRPERIVITGKSTKIDDLLRATAEELLRALDPFILANAYAQCDQTARAIELARYCTRHPPASDDAWAYILLGHLLAGQNQFDEASKMIDAALNIDGDFWLAHYSSGLVLSRQADWTFGEQKEHLITRAIDRFKRAIRRAPREPHIYLELAPLLVARRQDKEAIELYQTASRVAPDYWVPYFFLAEMKRRQQDHLQAYRFLVKAGELAPGNEAVCLKTRNLLTEMGDTAGAEALQCAPTPPVARCASLNQPSARASSGDQ
jgi:hypothetical protein